MTQFIWPSHRAILDDLTAYLSEMGQTLQVRSMEDYQAGFDRARLALDYLEAPDAASLAAILFDGVATRHPLVDGNKRLAWQCMTVFLDMNGVWFDAREYEAYEVAMAVIAHEKSVVDLAEFIRRNSIVL